MTKPPGITFTGQHSIDGKELFKADLLLAGGEWTCLLGRSGAGKSTILRLILGLETGGNFVGTIEASDGGSLPDRISYMAQSDLLLPWLTVRENVCIGARLRGDQPDLARANVLLKQVGLIQQAAHKPSSFSGGMRQRVALARTLYEDQPIVFLDEPFSALDAGTRVDMQDLTAEALEGRTVLLVTHDPAEAARLADKISIISERTIKDWPVPSTPALRKINDPQTLDCQAKLLNYLRGISA